MLAVLMVSLGSIPCFALPQFAILSGIRCSSCHVSPSGGGLRNENGWYAMHDVGMIPREDIPWLYSEDGSNALFDETVLVGTDMRLQSTRSFYDADASRVYIPMQVSAYAAYRPIQNLTLEGTFNLAALRTRQGTPVRFAGQRVGLFSALLRINNNLPLVRVGLFRPGIGVRYDDHTTFPNSYVSGRTRMNYVGPDWGEWGSEITWEKYRWLTLQVGVFGTSGLSQVQLSDGLVSRSAISGTMPTITGKAVTWNRFADNTVNTYAGASILVNNDFSVVSGFLGVGLTDAMYVMADVTQTSKTDVLTSLMGMAEVGWQVSSSFIPYVRIEHGTTKQSALPSPSELTSGIIGAQFFPLPFVEIRPEYRMLDTYYDGISTRWNVQLHLFY